MFRHDEKFGLVLCLIQDSTINLDWDCSAFANAEYVFHTKFSIL